MEHLNRIKLRGGEPWARLKNYVSDRGGRIANGMPRSMEQDVVIVCDKRHRWATRASKVISDQTWCPDCAVDRQRLGIDRAHAIARERGGTCLSESYQNVHTKMPWRCKKGHRFEQTVNEITQKGQWCPVCRVRAPVVGSARKSFDDLLETLAIAGITHTGTVTALHKKTEWQCECGFEWSATGQVMLKRKPENLCHNCAGIVPKTIEDMDAFARERGGRCLSTEYVNNRESLLWECANQHQWWAKWSNVGGKKRTWCPQC